MLNSSTAAAKSCLSKWMIRRRSVGFVRSCRRAVWTTGQEPCTPTHRLHSLTPDEISKVSSVSIKTLLENHPGSAVDDYRFTAINLKETRNSNKNEEEVTKEQQRAVEVVVLNSKTGIATEMVVQESTVLEKNELPRGVQPMFTPDDCELAEEIAKSSDMLKKVLSERYSITDMKKVVCDPWSIHLASEEDIKMLENTNKDGPCRRLVQTFLYQRMYGEDMEDNHYAHPIDIVPVIDLNTKTLVRIDGLERDPPPKVPEVSVNYHRNLVHTNTYLQNDWRGNTLKALDISQPDGPSFEVSDGNLVEWQNWSFRVGFNYREGLVLHDVKFNDRSVLKRGSLVEMAVPYADTNPPFQRKCAFDVGDYGLGYCANSLELGCDCLGHIHYFDACLNNAKGDPLLIKKAICMHEEDDGILWKHVEYRNGHNESRRARELVISSIATVVNYEYLFYWRLKLDGSIDFEIRLSGELSTNLTSSNEDPENPSHGTLVAPGVNAQIHQHMFCARLDMAVDGDKNSVSEVDVIPEPYCEQKNPYGNAFGPVETLLRTEQDAVRICDATKARSWKIFNTEGKINPISKKPVAYKLIPFTRGPSMPPVLTHPTASSVSTKGEFATANLWITPFDEKERFPAGEYTPQQIKKDGLPLWIQKNRSIENQNIVLWHSFGVTHVPRVEDFPVMPCETTGFTLKPDGFSAGNPAIDIPPDVNAGSKLSRGCCD